MEKLNVMVMILSAFASISIIPWTYGFNVETKHYTIYSEERNSMFGFSVAEHLSGDSNGWVIVGAPEAQTIQPGVYRGGAVYRCRPDKDNSCAEIYFDVNGNNVNTNPRAPVEVDNKTMQWFGATVSTSYELDGPILACAPRYMWYSANFARREPVGTCYITEHSFSQPKEFSPCRTKHWGYHKQGSCQAGLGAALSKDGQRVLIGAPGSFYWQGQTYSVDSKAEFTYMPPRYAHFGESPGQTFSAPTGSLPRVVTTKEGQAKDDDSYLGYSVTTGDFEGNGETGAAVGMPRGNNLHGQVVIFTANLTNHQKNLTGDQMGEYFGYSVIACDVNGDGLDDLIVGAPMYTINNPGKTFETGRVHIYYQENGLERFTRTETRIGFNSRSRFGLSLASLKDIDQDGCDDFAVGAPYDGPGGRGAVYIYHGSRDGVLKTFSQVIYAEDVESIPSTFGFSIAGGLDLDGNSYPDMVVGAYESSTATFFRSRPVIKMEAWVSFDSKSKFISLEEKDCVISGDTRVVCLPMQACMTFSGVGVQKSYLFNVEYALDTKKPSSGRLFFVEHERNNSINQTVRLSRDEQLCKTFKVYVISNITDKLTSIDAEMRMSLLEDSYAVRQTRNPTSELRPVLSAANSRPDSLSIFKSCGSDNICIPNLILNVTSSITKYLLASGDTLELDVLVNNTGEHAYEAVYYLKQPPGIQYVNIETLNKTGVPIDCSAPSSENNYTLMCTIGNPLPKNESAHFKVILQPIKSEGLKAYYELDMNVNSTNPELNGTQDDNRVLFRMPIWIQTEIVIEGTSRPKELYYNADNYTVENITNEWEFGPLLTHNYTIRNDGPSAIIKAEAYLIWPAATLAGDELLYLIDMPETTNSMKCAPANADYLSLKRVKSSTPLSRGGSYGITDAEKINQLANDTRRKHDEEHFVSGSGMKDYNYDTETEILVTSTGAKNFSDTYSTNYTNVGRGYTSEHHSSSYVAGQGRGGQSSGNYENLKIQQQRKEEERLQRIAYEQKEANRLRLENQQREAERIRLENQQREAERIRLENQQREAERIRLENQQREADRLRFENQQRAAERLRIIQQQEEADRLRIESERRQYESRVVGGGSGVSERLDNDNAESERLRIRLQQQREEAEERQRLEDDRRRIESQRVAAEERQRLEDNRRREEERLRTEAIARQQLSGNQQWGVERQRTYDRTEIPETYGVQRHYTTDTENSSRQRNGYGSASGEIVREENVHSTGNTGLNINLSNIGSSKDLEKFFSTLNHEAAAITTYTRDGQEYVQFDGRFRVREGQDYIQFRNGQTFAVLDRYGEPSYSTGQSQSDQRYLNMEGKLVGGEDGNIYIELKDGRKFRIPGTYSYQSTRTFTVGGGPREISEGSGRFTYGKQVTHEGSSGEGRRVFEPFGSNNYKEESYNEEYKSGRKIISGINAGGFDSARDTFGIDNIPTIRPEDRLNRYARESDVLNVEQFRKFERNQRDKREDIDLEEISNSQRSRRDEPINYGADLIGRGQVSSCKSAECVKLECTFGPLKKGEEVFIKVRYRVKAKTLNKIAANEKLKVSTQLITRVTKQEFLADTPDEELTKSHEIITIIHPSAAPVAPDVVPLWVVVLSACAGTIILLLLIFLLYKMGFFKRNRPNSAPERQPLNRNGHYSNDD